MPPALGSQAFVELAMTIRAFRSEDGTEQLCSILHEGTSRRALEALASCVHEHLDAPETIRSIGAGVEVACGSSAAPPR